MYQTTQNERTDLLKAPSEELNLFKYVKKTEENSSDIFLCKKQGAVNGRHQIFFMVGWFHNI